jgi:ABC-type uncharacterized transport system auxiliary subunit
MSDLRFRCLACADTAETVHKRADTKYLVDPGQKKLQVISDEKWGDRTNELVQTYNKLIMREGQQ